MSSIGSLLKVTTYGESHGQSVGCIIEGFPANTPISVSSIQNHLDRRKPGQSAITTSQSEADTVEIHSGLQNSLSLGTPICMVIRNLDTKPCDYSFRKIPRPGHADLTYKLKYGVNSDSGGGRASARETAARVAAGGLCLDYLETKGITVVAWVQQVFNLRVPEGVVCRNREEVETLGRLCIDGEIVNTRCPHLETANKVYEEIMRAKREGETLGGVISCRVQGFSEEFASFVEERKIRAALGHAMMSVPSVKGFQIRRISSEIELEVGFKPVSTIHIPQNTCDWEGEMKVLECKGRHDPCVLTRAVPIIESMTAIVLLDYLLHFQLF